MARHKGRKGRRQRMRRLLLVLLLPWLLTGCWDRTEIEDTAYVVSIGIDAEADEYRWTFRIVDPLQLPLGMLTSLPAKGGLASGNIVVRATSLEQGVQLIQASVMRIVSLEHVRWIGIGEETAKKGVAPLLEQFLRHNQMRRTAAVYIVQGKAVEPFIANKPVGDVNPIKFFEGIRLVQKRMHLSPPMSVQHLYSRLMSTGLDPILPAMGINRASQQPLESEMPPMDGRSLRGGQFPRRGGNPVEFAGTAVFRRDRLKGILTVDQTIALLALRGEMGKAYTSMPNPLLPGTYIAFRLHQENKPQYRLSLVKGRPTATVRLQFEGEILSGPGAIDYSSRENRRAVEKGVADYLEKEVYAPLLKQLYGEWETDPVGFGQLLRSRFATYDDWMAFGWQDHVRDLTAKVEVELFIRRFGLLMGSQLE